MAKRIRIAINGVGRIGRNAFKIALTKPELEVVAINDLGSLEVMAHLFRHDTAYGAYDQTVAIKGDNLVVGKNTIKFLSVKEPAELPWKDLKIDVVLES